MTPGHTKFQGMGVPRRQARKPSMTATMALGRTAIARALMTEPEILFADAPTGNLDRKTGSGILELLRSLNAEQKLTIVMVTHDQSIAGIADHTVRLVEGRVESV